MITQDGLIQVNKGLQGIDVKGKNYVMVNSRVEAFRELSPQGSIQTELVSLTDGVVTMKATVLDEDGRVLATGYAQEKETASYINRTSFIENCETSAIGRALGFCGIGIEKSIASAEEVRNAITQQEEKISETHVKALVSLCEQKGLDAYETFPDGVENLNYEQHDKAVKRLQKMKDKV